MIYLENGGLLTVEQIEERKYIQTTQEVKVICQQSK
jgi:hypothetical protein